MNPKPPKNYRLLTEEEKSEIIPHGSVYWNDTINKWVGIPWTGQKLPRGCGGKSDFYAVPDERYIAHCLAVKLVQHMRATGAEGLQIPVEIQECGLMDGTRVIVSIVRERLAA